MSYNVAAIDVHKKLLVVVVADVSENDPPVECRSFGSGAQQLSELRAWLEAHAVAEAVMESTAQYWKPVWLELEPHMKLHLAQAQSNRAPKGRKTDFGDAKRLLRRLVAGELMLSFVPEAEQRSWRSVTRARVQLVRERVQIHNQIESLLEEGRIKLSSVISDLLGASGQRILRALSSGITDADQLAALGDDRLRCGRPALLDALTGSMTPILCTLLAQHLDRVALVEQQMEQLSRLTAQQLQPHQDAILRLIEIPGIGVETAHQILAEIGPDAKAFETPQQLASWIGVCPGSNESAAVNHSSRSAKGNRFLRRALSQAAQAAVKKNGSHFQTLFRRFLVRMGFQKAIWAIAHRLTKLIWKLLHQNTRFIEFGQTLDPKAAKLAIQYHLRSLRKLGYQLPTA